MRRLLLGAFACAVLGGSLCCAAQDKGYWRAASTQANKITGDLTIGDARLTINFTGYTLALIHKLAPAEMGAAFDADVNNSGAGNLYRLDIPADKRFSHHNTLCGSEETQWMATYAEGKDLQVLFFSGGEMPVLSGEALANSSNVCGRFSYER